jgi:hypothetical protein
VLVVVEMFIFVFSRSVLGVVLFLILFSFRRCRRRIKSISDWSRIGVLVFVEFGLGVLGDLLRKERGVFKPTRCI